MLSLEALLEYHCSKAADVASRIFEKGMETYGEEIDYVVRYLGFLISVNDENSCVVFSLLDTVFNSSYRCTGSLRAGSFKLFTRAGTPVMGAVGAL